MKIKVSETTRLQLDWLVAKCEAETHDILLTAAQESNQRLVAERDALQAKLAALEKQEPVGEVDEDDSGLFVDLETPNGTVVKFGQKLYAAAGAAPVPEGWRSAVAMAYGHLWHVNNEPMAPIPLRSEESASYAARKLLRDLMTTKERGEAINAVQKLLAAAPKEQP